MRNYVDGPKKPCQRNEGPRKTWLCLAVAISRLPDASLELERLASIVKSEATSESHQLSDDTKESLRGIIAFLSTLPIWGCECTIHMPFHFCHFRVCFIDIAMAIVTEMLYQDINPTLISLYHFLFSKSQEWNSLRTDQSLGSEYPLRLVFYLAITSLEELRLEALQSSKGGHPRESEGSIFSSEMMFLLRDVQANYEYGLPGPKYDKFQGSWIGKQMHALLLIAVMVRNVLQGYKAADRLSLGSRTTNGAASTQLPSPQKLEFISPWYFTDNKEQHAESVAWREVTPLQPRFPLVTPNLVAPQGKKGRYFYPFSGDEWWSWYTTRVRDLARRLDEGEWCGMNTICGIRFACVREYEYMEGIRFRKTETNGAKYSVEALDGVDSIGAFTLRGEVDASDAKCTVHLRKQYDPKHARDWRGQVTPLGICGTYHKTWRQESDPNGYFWIWKREWMYAVFA